MKVYVASVKAPKVDAVKEIAEEYDSLAGAEVIGIEVETGVSEQPLTVEETVQGAINRAKMAFRDDATYSFGIESGMVEVSQSRSGHIHIIAAAIHDGSDMHLGLAGGYEIPEVLQNIIEEKGVKLSEACKLSGLTDDPDIGASVGIIHLLTGGRLDRKGYTKQALIMAMIHLENKK